MIDLDNDAYYRNIIEQTRDIILVADSCGSILMANAAAVTVYGYSSDEFHGMRLDDLCSAQTGVSVAAPLGSVQQEVAPFRTVHRRRTGEAFPVEVSCRRICLADQAVFVCIVRDIAATIALEDAIRQSEEKYQSLHEDLTAAYEELVASEEELRQQLEELLKTENTMRQQNIVLTAVHDTAIGLMNRLDLDEVLYEIISGAASLLGAPDGYINLVDEAKNVFVRKVAVGRFVQDMTRQTPITEGLLGQAYSTGRIAIVDDYQHWEFRLPDPIFDWTHCCVIVPLKAGERVIGAFGLGFTEPGRTLAEHEISLLQRFADMASIALDNATLFTSYKSELKKRKEHEQFIRRLAYYDALTGLPNRACLHEFLEEAAEEARQGKACGAVLFVDLDNLKMVNDTFGHSYGDGVIIKAGAYICAEMGEEAFVARSGGDEFIVVLPGEDDREKIKEIANGMVSLLERDYETGSFSTYMSASVGIVLYPEDAGTAEDILKKADLALHAAKQNGKNTWYFYEADLQKAAYDDLLIKQGFREAIKRNELSLHYQPIVDTHTSNVVSFEALLRWNSSELGPIPPGRFIPLAEESGAIQRIGRWVVCEACRFASKLSKMGKSDIRVSINVSPCQLTDDQFVAFIRDAIHAAGIKPQQLEIEITENALMLSMEESIQTFKTLRGLGVHLSLDDFGTGYCSLNYLKNLPVKTLKIDKSFIDDIASDKNQLRFVKSIVSMAHVQGLSVVAEGVESESQWDKLRRCRCDFVQGYVFSRPMPEREAMLFLDR